MAKYDDTRFYWLQLKEDFFEQDALEWLEEQENGPAQALFYLKLCLRSLKTDGVLIRRVGEMYLPYDATKLAQMTRTPVNTVQVALVNLVRCGLIHKFDGGELYMTQVENMIGNTSKGAFKKQQQRKLRASMEVPPALPEPENARQIRENQPEIRGVDICPPSCPPKIELELEIRTRNKKEGVQISDEQEATPSRLPSEAALPSSDPVPFSKIQDLFNTTCKSLSKVQRMTDGRRKQIAARWKDLGKNLEAFRDLFEKTEASDFLTGTNDRGWRADFDWLMKPANATKVLEGNYDNRDHTKGDTHHDNRDRTAPKSSDPDFWKREAERQAEEPDPDFFNL